MIARLTLLFVAGCGLAAEPPPGTPPAATPKPPALTADDQAARAVSAFLAKALESRRKELADDFREVLADLRRQVTSLDEQRFHHLEIAAAGAIEHSLQGWKAEYGKSVREASKGQALESLSEVLQRCDSHQASIADPDQDSVWTTALAETLTTAELATWKSVLQGRAQRDEQALRALAIVELQAMLSLSPAQVQRLAPAFDRTLSDYLPDLIQQQGQGGKLTQIQICLLALCLKALPEADVRAILSKEQWQRFEEQTAELNDQWGDIHKRHQQRRKPKAKAAAKPAAAASTAKP